MNTISGVKKVIEDILLKERKERNELLKRAKKGDPEAVEKIWRRYKLRFLDPKEYLFEKKKEKLFAQARELGIPARVFTKISIISIKTLLEKLVRNAHWRWKEMIEEFEEYLKEPERYLKEPKKLEKVLLNGIRKLEFIERYGKEATSAVLECLIKDNKERTIDLLISMIMTFNLWREKELQYRYWRKFLEPFDKEKLWLIFFNLFWHTKLIAESVSGIRSGGRGEIKRVLKILLESGGIGKVRNICCKKYVAKIIEKGKFRKRRLKIPKFKVKIVGKKSGNRRKKVFYIGKYNVRKYEYITIKGRVPQKGPPVGSELTFSQFKFIKYYGWILISEDKRLYFVRERKGEIKLLNFKWTQPVEDYIKSKEHHRIPILPFRKRLTKKSLFFLVSIKRKKAKVKFENCCREGDLVEMKPIKKGGKWILKFYKVVGADRKEKLRTYRLKRKYPYLKRID